MSLHYERTREARFISRPNRFLAHVLLDDEVVVCHVKNTGRCRELLLSGARVIIAPAKNPLRKTAFDLVAVYKGDMLVNIDSQAPNRVAMAWLRQQYPSAVIKAEARAGDSRLDFLVNLLPDWDHRTAPQPPDSLLYVEVKGVTLEVGGVALFPDAPTPRGARHLRELRSLAQRGHQAMALFVVQVRPVTSFSPHATMDPAFADALRVAAAGGVQVLAIDCVVTENSLTPGNPVRVRL